MIDLILEKIEDVHARENFQKLLETLNKNPLLNGSLTLFESSPRRADASHKVIHNLGYIPTDIIITHVSNNSSVTPVFGDTTKNVLAFNVTGACYFRVLVGRFS